MPVLIVSDVHANLPALEAVLSAAGAVDAVWHLGDVVGYGPDPDAVVARLRDRGAIGVRGNHDSAAIGGREIELFNTDARRAMEWTRATIRTETIEWLAALPELRVEGDVTMVHGSPRDPMWEYVTSIGVARANLQRLSTPWCCYGHTHLPMAYRDDSGRVEQFAPADGSTIQLDPRRTMLNPGSVGQPRDGIPTASFAILDPGTQIVRWHRVAYDIGATQAAMRRVGLPDRLIARLDYGL